MRFDGRRHWKLSSVLAAVAMAILTWPACAADNPAGEALLAIQDNSFLVEEAYNQDPGVVQHISVLQRDRHSDSWNFGFTQEWPAPSLRHQLSFSLGYVHGDSSGIGDTLLNYRYQLTGTAESRLAIAPRISLILPTGSESKGLGSGSEGLQAALPVSYVLSPRLISHSNAGVTWLRKGDVVSWNVGQSVIFAASSRMHLMLEGVWTGGQDVDDSAFISPGARFAFNFPSGLQIVPGIAFPIGVGPTHHSDSVLLYLSFEHPFRKIGG